MAADAANDRVARSGAVELGNRIRHAENHGISDPARTADVRVGVELGSQYTCCDLTALRVGDALPRDVNPFDQALDQLTSLARAIRLARSISFTTLASRMGGFF